MSDYISRQEAVDLLEELETKRLKGDVSLLYAPMIKGLKKLPSAQPERKKGKWILPNNPIAVSLNEWICSECKYLIDGKHNFCSNCGADMRGEKDG